MNETTEAKYSLYSKGSEWRQWDLHFHTPSSFDYGDKSIANSQIIDTLSKEGISVVAITDHNIIDIDRVKQLQGLGRVKGITVLPGIELRGDNGGRESIHFIGIFSENCNLEEVWMQLRTRCNLKDSDIEKYTHEKIYCQFFNTAKVIHELGGIITIHAGKKTNSVENITNSLSYKQAIKTDIAKLVDVYELGKEKDATGYIENVFPHIEKRLPMIICSDNHKVSKYTRKQKLWIKADPTFLGLKQILSEPEDRVRICSDKPEKKYKSNVINRVRFIDTSINDYFSQDWIPINQNLNTIIGGKSTGKSLLMYYMAKTIDHKLDSSVHYTFSDLDFEVEWADGVIYKLSNGAYEDTSKEVKKSRPITYISQLYIHDLLENDKAKFNELILNFLREDEAFDSYFTNYKKNLREITSDIGKILSLVLSLREAVEEIKEEITRLGDKNAKITELRGLTAEINEIKAKSEFTDDEQDELNSLQGVKEQKEKSLRILQRKLSSVDKIKEHYKEVYKQAHAGVTLFIQNDIEYLDEHNKNEFRQLTEHMDERFDDFMKKIDIDIILGNDLSEKAEKIDVELKEINEKIEHLLSKSEFQDRIKALEGEKENYEDQLNKIIDKERKYDTEKAKLDARIEELIGLFERRYNIYNDYAKKINIENSALIEEDGITLKAILGFRGEDFSYQFVDKFNLKQTNFGLSYPSMFDVNEYKNIPDAHCHNVETILKDLISGDKNFKYKKSNNLETVITALMEDYNHVIFQLSQRDDNIERMSPGKKGLVLLKLYLSLNKADYPIMIDQPEDNLDNRTVYSQLKDFLRKKKNQRQIIMVTHNSNLVISTDSEQIIVANQNGEDGKDNERFTFEYVTGSLEFSQPLNVNSKGVLKQIGIREHVCAILEGGEEAFKKREIKYGFKETGA